MKIKVRFQIGYVCHLSVEYKISVCCENPGLILFKDKIQELFKRSSALNRESLETAMKPKFDMAITPYKVDCLFESAAGCLRERETKLLKTNSYYTHSDACEH